MPARCVSGTAPAVCHGRMALFPLLTSPRPPPAHVSPRSFPRDLLICRGCSRGLPAYVSPCCALGRCPPSGACARGLDAVGLEVACSSSSSSSSLPLCVQRRGAGRRTSVDLRHVPPHRLELVHLRPGLCLGHAAFGLEDLEDGCKNVLLWLLRAAQEECALRAVHPEVPPDGILLLHDLVLHVHLLGSVARPCVTALHQALALVLFELVAIVILGLRISAAEEKGEGAYRDAFRLLVSALLHESAKRGQASAKACHEHRDALVLGHVHH
mmetsp:Transcript_2441/g.6557  ORF Transcript_2441/g.6557 Transcript_2441/m.6557 type:complete len:270 (+) Transcript_2441:66-875(+)